MTIKRRYPFKTTQPTEWATMTLLNDGKVVSKVHETIDRGGRALEGIASPIQNNYTTVYSQHRFGTAVVYISDTRVIHIYLNNGTPSYQTINPQLTSTNIAASGDFVGLTAVTHVHALKVTDTRILVIFAKANSTTTPAGTTGDSIDSHIFDVMPDGSLMLVASKQHTSGGYVHAPQFLTVMSGRGVFVVYQSTTGSKETKAFLVSLEANNTISATSPVATAAPGTFGTFNTFGASVSLCKWHETAVLMLGKEDVGFAVRWRMILISISETNKTVAFSQSWADPILTDGEYAVIEHIATNIFIAYYPKAQDGYWRHYFSLLDATNNFKEIYRVEADNVYANILPPTTATVKFSKLIHSAQMKNVPIAVKLSGNKVAFLGQSSTFTQSNEPATFSSTFGACVTVEMTDDRAGLIVNEPFPLFNNLGSSIGYELQVNPIGGGKFVYFSSGNTTTYRYVGIFDESYFNTGEPIGLTNKNGDVVLKGIVETDKFLPLIGRKAYTRFAYPSGGTGDPTATSNSRAMLLGTTVSRTALLMPDFFGLHPAE